MRKSFACSRRTLLLTTAFGSLLAGNSAYAQDAIGVQSSDELIVYGTVVTRNRTDTVSPTLSYDLEYFQRFEPISAGDALKRLPGVSFSSDMLEYDQVQLRGLPSNYAQVQINGQNMSGAGNDRVFFVDRIPAELIDGIEVIRSPSADQSSEGIGGTVNAKLKRAGQIKGGWVRGSGFGVEDDELRGAGSIGYGDTIGDTSYLMSMDVQQRRNPKFKDTKVYDADGNLKEFSTQQDTRDGTDYAFNGEVAQKMGDGLLRLYGFYVLTDRTEKEYTPLFEEDNGAFPLTEIGTQHEGIVQQNMSIVSEYTVPVGKDEAKILFGYNRFNDNLATAERVSEPPDPFQPDGWEYVDTLDQDWFSTLAYTANVNSLVSVKVGVDGRIKTRDFSQILLDEDGQDDSGPNGQFDIEERRIDPYVKATWNLVPGLTVETGVRYEYTERELSGPGFGSSEDDFGELNPSAHIRYALTDTTMLRFSVARTVLRPSFDMLTPADLEEEPTDEFATRGNPNLQQETAWGIDVGFDQKIGDRGILGFNFFNRAIKDKIELVGDGTELPGNGCDNDPCKLLTYQNVGDGRAWGIEVDVDLPLTALGLPDTSVFANYTWLRSEVEDPLFPGVKRRFRDQPDYIYNIGLIQNLPSWNSTFGVTYQKRGESYTFDYDEIEKLTYEGNLEAFWETRLSKSTVLRFTGANLLDAEKVENKQLFDKDRTQDFDGTEIEREKSGRLFLMTVRQAF
ncbi:TonB-dependent receptor plug domain-containing protein [Hyphomicrobium sp.]|uniref:TonB-dependent receptor plug domain-containing protein n=1 Tax=Hyphomicrobium sp. TaxID=82 RepID=UPI002E375064|nr:TonB-dependent receptor [Hyphomicrobium sp.]HEX2841022.1 TonB-dependent receptor [Hyphomicrobium sp.]